MSVAMIGPKFYAWSKNGKPLAFGKLYTYQTQTNIDKATYISEDQLTENTNPIILNGEGYADVYLSGSYKMVLKDSDENEIWSSDPVSSYRSEEWVNCIAATYVSPSSFKILGNFSEEYSNGRRVRLDSDEAGYDYATIKSSSYAGGYTTASIYTGLSSVPVGLVETCVSIISANSIPVAIDQLAVFVSVDDMTTNYTEKVSDSTIDINDVLSETQGYYGGWAALLEPQGSAQYLLTTLQRVRDSKADQLWVPDGLIDHYLAGGQVYVATYLGNGSITIMQAGAKDNMAEDSRDSIQACFDSDYITEIPKGEFAYASPIDSGTSKVIGAGTQQAQLYYTGDPLFAGTTFKYSSGAVLQDFRLLGPFSATQAVANELIGLSTQNNFADTVPANRVVLRNVRAEAFGTNFYNRETQNSDFTGLFSQYAKYAEFYVKDTENCWFTKCNSNSPLQIPITPDTNYKMLRLEGNRNLQFTHGIHERANGINNPYLVVGGSVDFTGVEFNGSSTATDPYGLLIARSNSLVNMVRCKFTLSGAGEIYAKAEDTSVINVTDPLLAGAGGAHRYSLTRGYVTDGSNNDSAITLLGKSALSQFIDSSGGSGEIVDGRLLVIGAGFAQGIRINDQASNNDWSKVTGDGIGGAYFTVCVASLSGALKLNVFKLLPATPFRVLLGEITTPGVYSFPTALNTGDSLSSMGLGVDWDGATIDPTYGSKGVVHVLSTSIKLSRSGQDT